MEYIKCPFCKEEDFDLIGLKHHFESGSCVIYEETIDLPKIGKWALKQPTEPAKDYDEEIK